MRERTRAFLCVMLVFCGGIGISLLFGSAPAVETGSWGLSFSQEGQPPVGNAAPESLARYDAAYVGNGEEKVLYLTFDAGYENGCTAQILDVLKLHQVPATFFLVGNYLQTQPELVRRMVAEGHTVGNHTWHHYNMSRISDPAAFHDELVLVEEEFRRITGQEMPKFYRPPQGEYSEENLIQAKELGYKTVFWSLAYVDWNNDSQPTAQQAYDKLLPRIHNGAVILLHSTSTTNAAILHTLLTEYEQMGYTFRPIEELFQ